MPIINFFCQNHQKSTNVHCFLFFIYKSLFLFLKYIGYKFYGCTTIFDEFMIFWKKKNFVIFFFFGKKIIKGESPLIIFFPKKKKKSQNFFFSKYHKFVKNSRTTIKFIPNVLWEQKKRFVDEKQKAMNICWFLMILAKKVDYGQKIRFYEKKVGNFSTSKCSKNCAFLYFSKTNFLRGSFRLKKRPLKGFCEKTKRTVFLTIFVNLQKRLETAVLEGHCKFSMKSIIYVCHFVIVFLQFFHPK